MNISSPFIARPVATLLLAIGVLLAGVLGYRALPISSLPEVDFPTIQVSTQLPGASAETMAALVTAPLERQLGQVSSLESMVSTSSPGLSQITMQFTLDRDIDAAGQDVQSAIDAAGGSLPDDLPYPPAYAKVNPADQPIITLALTSKELPISTLSDFADTLIAQRLSSLTGVGRVSVQGGLRPAVRIQVDIDRLSGLGLGMEALRSAIADANTMGPKGAIDGTEKSFTVGANDQLVDAEAYRNVIVTYRNGAPVRVRDVAQVTDGLENTKVAAWHDGQPAVVIDVQRQPGANIVGTVERVQAMLPNLQQALPAGVDVTVVNDRTGTIRASVHDVQLTLVVATVLVVMVVFVFLRSVSATLIAAAALPLSLVATFGVMWFMGFSLDNLSLMALTIGTGFVVDDAIVMIENITRKIEEGKRPLEAAYAGAGEIGFTVVSLTLSLIAVFIPLLFMTGIVGRLFHEFAMTLTVAVVTSAVVSLTLTPMMCSRLMRPHVDTPPGAVGRLADRILDGIEGAYARSLMVVLRHQGTTLLVALLTAVLTVWLYILVPKGFLPAQDTGLLSATIESREDVSFQAMRQIQADVAARIAGDPDVTGTTALAGVGTSNPTANTARLTINLTPKDERADGMDAIVARLQARLDDMIGVRVYFQPVQDVQIGTTTSRTQYQYRLTATDAEEVATWSRRLATHMATLPELRDVASDLQDGGTQVRVRVDRVAAGRLGVTMQAVEDALFDAFGQRQISTIFGQSNQYRVVLEAHPRFQEDPAVLDRIYVDGEGGTQVPLMSVASIERAVAPLVVNRQDQFPAVTLSFDLAQGVSLSHAVEAIERVSQSIGMPSSVGATFTGDAAEFGASTRNEPWLILAAAVVIYIVLGVLYESLIHPFTILTTLPSAGVGALLALMLFGLDLSLPGLIGIILLMGIVKKNAIIMIDFAIHAERHERLSPRDAIFKAATLRFRPITMTTLAALLGAVPLAIGQGIGSELRVPLGVTIIGGLMLSQVLTLYTTPVIYLAMDRLKDRLYRPARAGRVVVDDGDFAGRPAE
ncbi:efflux RND transporter permease subunit [Marinivivus vitaminiproducens]|uniref:efflux RND transporter permease subunit n=1 Tax=Marinivivus vitaminiproducens TaxID=3035935 RepID=UPI00279F6BC4|nr:efflux RND transporter permease subunit [Geminicoccaceae bacterium SCSIO 64248]